MSSQLSAASQQVLYRLHAAQNRRDLDELVGCFASDVEFEEPNHSGLAFVGRDRLRENWMRILNGLPDFRSELLRSAVEGETVWAEWRWCGTPNEGDRYDWRGVTILRVEHGKITWARWFMEPVGASYTGMEQHLELHSLEDL